MSDWHRNSIQCAGDKNAHDQNFSNDPGTHGNHRGRRRGVKKDVPGNEEAAKERARVVIRKRLGVDPVRVVITPVPRGYFSEASYPL